MQRATVPIPRREGPVCRYATLLREKGAARVGLLCHPALTTLFASLVDVDAVIAADGEIPRTGWDCWENYNF